MASKPIAFLMADLVSPKSRMPLTISPYSENHFRETIVPDQVRGVADGMVKTNSPMTSTFLADATS